MAKHAQYVVEGSQTRWPAFDEPRHFLRQYIVMHNAKGTAREFLHAAIRAQE